MLTHLSIRNFTLVDSLELDLSGGLTAMTGETGAGKSLLIDALSLALGERAEYDRIRHGCDRSEISAHFDLSKRPSAHQWLTDNDFELEDECILRRVITREGRSRSYINGQSATTKQLRELGEQLLDIHSQHAHQSLLKKETHRELLDTFGGHTENANIVKVLFKEWQTAKQTYTEARDNAEENSERAQLLNYQISELDSLALEPGELETLEAEQLQIDHAEGILSAGNHLLATCTNEQVGIQTLMRQAIVQIEQLTSVPEPYSAALEMLLSAEIQIQEASSEVSRFIDGFEADQERQQWVAERLNTAYEIARKHRISPQDLMDFHQRLAEEIKTIACDDDQLEALKQAAESAETRFLEVAKSLSENRKNTAKALTSKINEQLHQLDMPNSHLAIQVENLAKPNDTGLDTIEILISTNPGQPVKSLGKVASGGELSRVSLAIQVVIAQNAHLGTLVFDEVDVGIGGATAGTVGLLLKQLGQAGQVLCVTHLPQVASQAHNHLHISKQSSNANAASSLSVLNTTERVEEIARMLGGQKITQQTLAHAKEMLQHGISTVQ